MLAVRSAFWPTFRVRNCASVCLRTDEEELELKVRHSGSTWTTRRATRRRVQLPHGDLRGARSRTPPSGQRRKDPSQGRKTAARISPTAPSCRRHDLESQGRERAGRGAAAGGAVATRTGRIWNLSARLASTGWRCRFVQRPEDVFEARDLARGRAAILSKIEKPAAVKAFDEILAVSDGDHGRARRSGRRTARAVRAADPEAPGAQMPCRGQAGDRRHPDAGIDDREPDADPRRSLGRCRRDLRRCRCGHAVGRKRCGQLPDRSGAAR